MSLPTERLEPAMNRSRSRLQTLSVSALLGVVMLLLAACVEINVNSPDNATPTPDSETAAAPTATATSTPASIPTTEPTPTPEATATLPPEPTSTPVPDPSPTPEPTIELGDPFAITNDEVLGMLLTSEDVSGLLAGQIDRTIYQETPRYPGGLEYPGTHAAIGLSKFTNFCDSPLEDGDIVEILEAEVVMESDQTTLFDPVITQSIHVLPDDTSADWVTHLLRTDIFGCGAWTVQAEEGIDVTWDLTVTEIVDTADGAFHVFGVPSDGLGTDLGFIDLTVVHHDRFISVATKLLVEESFDHELAHLIADKLAETMPE